MVANSRSGAAAFRYGSTLRTMKASTIISIGAALIIFGGIVMYGVTHRPVQPDTSLAPLATSSTESVLPAQYSTPGQRTYYRNDDYGYYFEIPKGFFIGEYGVGSKEPEVLLQNADKTKLILIRMTPAQGDFSTITEQGIMAINNEFQIRTPLERVRVDGTAPGVSFGTNGETWGIGWRIWFFRNGTLYRLSSTEELAPLQKAIVATWKFTK